MSEKITGIIKKGGGRLEKNELGEALRNTKEIAATTKEMWTRKEYIKKVAESFLQSIQRDDVDTNKLLTELLTTLKVFSINPTVDSLSIKGRLEVLREIKKGLATNPPTWRDKYNQINIRIDQILSDPTLLYTRVEKASEALVNFLSRDITPKNLDIPLQLAALAIVRGSIHPDASEIDAGKALHNLTADIIVSEREVKKVLPTSPEEILANLTENASRAAGAVGEGVIFGVNQLGQGTGMIVDSVQTGYSQGLKANQNSNSN